MIQKVEMYTVICDNCKVDAGMDSEYSCWGDESTAEESAMDSDWKKEGDKHYCPSCVSYEEGDVFIIDPQRKDKYAS